ALAHHQLDHLMGYVASHVVVGTPPGENQVGVMADLRRLVGEVIRIDADAVAADQTGPKRQEVPFGAGRFEYFQRVDTEFVEKLGQVVDQGDVDVALGVFDDLGRLGDLDA